MLADSTRIAWMQAQHQLPGDFGDTYDEFLYRYTNWWINDPQLYLLGEDSTQWTWDWSSQWATSEAEYSVVLWRVNGDPVQLKRCRFIARQVIDRVQATDFAALEFYEAEELHRQMSAAGMLLLDWCYEALPVALRQQLAQALYLQARAFMGRFILSSGGTSYVSSHNTWNCVYANQNALVLHGADGLTVEQQDTVLQWHEVVYDKWVNGFFPVYQHYRNDDGGWNWGAAYAMWSLIDQFQLFDNMLIATGTDWYTGLPWVRNSINQYLYFIQPDEISLHLGDGLARLYGDRVVYRHASVFQDPRSMWMAQHFDQPSYFGSTDPLYQKFIHKDFTLPTVAFPDPPLDWWSDQVGLSVGRSSWAADATMVTFFCSPSKRAAHEHRDNNSFAVFKNTPLLLDAGHYDSYGSAHMRDYYSRTIAHNSICVYDSLEQMTSMGMAATNDGGQIDSPPLQDLNDVLAPQNQRGEWVKWAAGVGYQYSIADAALSYDPAKLDRFTRRLLFLKPDRVLVLDHVHLNNVGTAQRDVQWTAHFAQRPTMSGAQLDATVPGHIETYDGPDHVSVNGNGSVALRTLLPAATRTTRIGGPGYAYWVDGADRPPSTSIDTTVYTPGSWRIEVRPATVSDPVVFLHSIRVGDGTNTAQPAGQVLTSATTIAVDQGDTLVLFAASGDTGLTHHRVDALAGGRDVHFMALDLADGSHCLYIDGAWASTLAIDAQGTATLTWPLPAGTHQVIIGDCSTGIDAPDAASLQVLAHPNPTTGRVRFDPRSGVGRGELVRVVSVLGAVLFEGLYAEGVELGGLPSGAYVLHVPRLGLRALVVRE